MIEVENKQTNFFLTPIDQFYTSAIGSLDADTFESPSKYNFCYMEKFLFSNTKTKSKKKKRIHKISEIVNIYNIAHTKKDVEIKFELDILNLTLVHKNDLKNINQIECFKDETININEKIPLKKNSDIFKQNKTATSIIFGENEKNDDKYSILIN